MDLLAKLEHALEGMVEGVFSRAFKAPLQPVEVAKRLTREMESHRTVSVNATYVPNVYTVQLSPETYAGFEAISGRLLAELTQYLQEFIAGHHYQLVGPISVRLEASEQLKGHEINISVANREEAVSAAATSAPTPVAGATQRTAPFSLPSSTEQSAAAPARELEVTAGEAQGSHIPLTNAITIGRGPTNTLALSEPDISRRHAEIIFQHGAWELHDLGSTNGTFVNERRVSSHVLLPGDSIQIGHTSILVR